MDPLPPIPTPVAQRWREFRIQVLPLIIFAATLAAVFFLWKNYVAPAAIVGQVETNTVSVTTTVAGLLGGVTAGRFQDVKAGDILATVSPFDPEVTKAALEAAEAEVRVIQSRMSLNEVQSLDAGARLRLDLLLQRTLLAIAQVKLDEAETNLTRSAILLKDNIIAQAQYDIVKANRDALRAEVAERRHLVEQWEKEALLLQPQQAGAITNSAQIIEQNILRLQEHIRQEQKPLVLKAPIDGKISAINFRAGERVPANARILTITPIEPKRILAFVRQPITYHPKVGDTVTVSTRTLRRRTSPAQVIQVGAQMEMISLFLIPMDRPRPEQGLPIAVSLPRELGLLPGEIVDIRIPPARN